MYLLEAVVPSGMGPVGVVGGDQPWAPQSAGPSRKPWKEASGLRVFRSVAPDAGSAGGQGDTARSQFLLLFDAQLCNFLVCFLRLGNRLRKTSGT